MATKTLNVVHTKTGEIVRTIDVSSQSERQIEKTEMGLLRNMNRDEFHVARAPNPAGARADEKEGAA